MSETTTGGKRRAEPPRDTVRTVRRWVASAIWLVAVAAALVLAAGALVVALDFNEDNALVAFLVDTAERVNVLGEMKTFEGGRSEASQQSALTKTVLVNWGICAVAYLVVGKLLDRLIRP
jgi:anti-sigma factor RsiW